MKIHNADLVKRLERLEVAGVAVVNEDRAYRVRWLLANAASGRAAWAAKKLKGRHFRVITDYGLAFILRTR